MPLPGFISSFADKAQTAINASPLAGHIPGMTPTSPAEGPTANQAAAQGGKSSHTLGAIQHQLRQFGQQYSSASPVQKVITTSKGISIDFDSVSRDAKAQSKELYTWGQTQGEDLKDVTDRLAYMNFVQGSLAGTLAVKLNDSRAALKELRDAENNLAPRRNIRAGFETQITRIEHQQEKGMESKLAQLREQLHKAQGEDEALENEIEVLKRKGVRESEKEKWDALREYGEKLVLLAQSASTVVAALPSVPPSTSSPYTGTQTTAGARAALQRALDNYKTGQIHLPSHKDSMDSHRDSTRSFGETHSSELLGIHTSDATSTAMPNVPMTPPAQPPYPQHELGVPASPAALHPQPHPVPTAAIPIPHPATSPGGTNPFHSPTSPVINPALLNQTPAQIPTPPPVAAATSPSPAVPVDSHSPAGAQVPGITPTVAETGIPVGSSDHGPGPATGSLKDIRREHSASMDARHGGAPPQVPSLAPLPPATGTATHYESADDEKKRMQREERERVLGGAPGAPGAQKYETADDEKKRLEREERDRILANQGQTDGTSRHGTGEDNDLPPYQEPGQM